MKCAKCQKSDFKTIHGRDFCANCSEQAADRLGSFETENTVDARKIGNYQPPQENTATQTKEADAWLRQSPTLSNVLDLSQSQYSKVKQVGNYSPKAKPQANLNHSVAKDALNLAVEHPDLVKAAENTIKEAPPEAQVSKMQPRHKHKVPKKPIEAASEQLAEVNLDDEDQKKSAIAKIRMPKLKLANPFSANFMRLAAITASMVLLVGYVTYLNYPNMALRVAASRASINASMPGYLPSGYSFSGPIAYSPGQLVVNFQGGDDKRISLSQSSTRWDSNSLLEEYVKLRTSTFVTYRDKGLTIYTYDDRHAVWVNGGVLYEIEAEGELDPEEIVRIAGSL